jgi:hypothetical protein
MGAISYIPSGLTEAQITAIVQAELVLNPPGSQLPSYAAAPSGYSEGQLYRNETDGLVYVMNNGSFKALDMTVDSFHKTLTAGTSATILASEHKLESVTSVKVYSPADKEVIVDYSVNSGLTVTVNSEIDLLNYKLKISN